MSERRFGRAWRLRRQAGVARRSREKIRGRVERLAELPRILTWESEVRAIAEEAARWTIETGGDLFGLWGQTPTIYLATRAGPKAVRDRAHFRLDVDYLRSMSEALASDWGLRYFGDWHSHHRLGLADPSSGDRQRIVRLAARNAFAEMSEVIVTLDGDERRAAPVVRLHPWAYWTLSEEAEPMTTALEVLPGVSPIREALISRGALPEQEFDRWSEVPSERIRIGTDPKALVPSGTGSADSSIGGRVLHHACTALEQAGTSPVERHETAFGWVLAVPVDDLRLVGIAVERSWPHRILEVDWIDRDRRTTEALAVSAPPSILSPEELVSVYRTVRKLKQGEERPTDVDYDAT